MCGLGRGHTLPAPCPAVGPSTPVGGGVSGAPEEAAWCGDGSESFPPAHTPATSRGPPLTSRESTAAYMMSIQPLKVACENVVGCEGRGYSLLPPSMSFPPRSGMVHPRSCLLRVPLGRQASKYRQVWTRPLSPPALEAGGGFPNEQWLWAQSQ